MRQKINLNISNTYTRRHDGEFEILGLISTLIGWARQEPLALPLEVPLLLSLSHSFTVTPSRTRANRLDVSSPAPQIAPSVRLLTKLMTASIDHAYQILISNPTSARVLTRRARNRCPVYETANTLKFSLIYNSLEIDSCITSSKFEFVPTISP